MKNAVTMIERLATVAVLVSPGFSRALYGGDDAPHALKQPRPEKPRSATTLSRFRGRHRNRKSRSSHAMFTSKERPSGNT
jgi:hypothetical protein